MRTPQLLCSTMIAASLAVTVACNRADTETTAERAAAGMKTAAAKAGEQISDGWITTKIQAKYFADDDVKARYINVSTRDGIVTISGYVGSPAERDEALQIAKTTDGVTQVQDRLAVAIAGQPAPASASAPEDRPVATSGTVAEAAREVTGKIDDALITASVQAKYFLDERVKSRKIDVDTKDGVVTLRGEVSNNDERAQALLLARTTAGVERVEDHLVVNASMPPPSPAPLTDAEKMAPARTEDAALVSAIQSKLEADAGIASATIDVSARDGMVLLQGTVPTQAARKQAISLAQGTDGVIQVVDRLKVGKPSN